MEKKYYDLIVTLIKNHRKYPGLESLLDDIAQDAYNHAQVVLGTITNEDVITSYLNKVVSTSIITVPKRMNFNTRAHHRVILPPLKEHEPPVENEIHINVPEPEHDVNLEEELDKLIQEESGVNDKVSTEETNVTEVNNSVDEAQEINKPEPEEPVIEETQTEDTLEEVADIELDESEKVEKDLEETVEELEVSELPKPDVDKTLVDKMINGHAGVNHEGIENIEDVTELETDNTEDIELSSPEELEQNEISDIDELTVEDEPIEELSDNLDELEASTEIPTLDEDLELEETVQDELLEDSIEPKTEELANSEEEEEEEEYISSIDEPKEEVLEETLEGHFDDNEFDELLASSEHSDLEELGDSDFLQSEVTTTKQNFVPPSYDCFEYTPDKTPKFDINEINENLSEINSKHPELHVPEVYNLKYKDGKSIDEISEELGITQDAVLEALSEIIYTIKD